MKIALSSRQNKEYLNKADEIIVEWRDNAQIMDLGHDYPEKTIVLDTDGYEDNDKFESIIKNSNRLARNCLIVKVHDLWLANWCKENNIKFYLDYNIRTFYELKAISKMGVSYIQIDAPIFFKMDLVKKYNIPIRINPLITNNSRFMEVNSETGVWVRPEDIKKYDPCTIEFGKQDRKREQGLWRVYSSGQWSGALSVLIPNIDRGVLNRLIAPEVGEKRLNCGQRCLEDGSCRICHRALQLASMKNQIEEYLDEFDLTLEDK